MADLDLELSESPLPTTATQSGAGVASSPQLKKAKTGTGSPGPQGEESLDGSVSVGVEKLEQDEFEFLDDVTRLAVLQSEIDDTRRGLARAKNAGNYVPMKLFRGWGHRVLSVTDLAAGLWCQVQVEYRHLHPHLRTTTEWVEMKERGTPVVRKTEGMKKGCAVHLKKELEVHEIIEVENVTKEDRYAVQLINMYTQLATIQAGELEREISVFGDPFDCGVMIRGIIDQLQLSSDSRELVLLDYKTRLSKSLPTEAQRKGTALQLMLYKCLLDRITCGVTGSELLFKHLKLNSSRVLTRGPLGYIHQCGLSSVLSSSGSSSPGDTCVTFGRVANSIMSLVVGLGLPLVTSLVVQYEHQESGEVLGVDHVEYDECWMEREVGRNLKFWEGEEPAEGVEVEEAWKCNSCQFKDVCVWQLRRKLENSPAALPSASKE